MSVTPVIKNDYQPSLANAALPTMPLMAYSHPVALPLHPVVLKNRISTERGPIFTKEQFSLLGVKGVFGVVTTLMNAMLLKAPTSKILLTEAGIIGGEHALACFLDNRLKNTKQNNFEEVVSKLTYINILLSGAGAALITGIGASFSRKRLKAGTLFETFVLNSILGFIEGLCAKKVSTWTSTIAVKKNEQLDTANQVRVYP